MRVESEGQGDAVGALLSAINAVSKSANQSELAQALLNGCYHAFGVQDGCVQLSSPEHLGSADLISGTEGRIAAGSKDLPAAFPRLRDRAFQEKRAVFENHAVSADLETKSIEGILNVLFAPIIIEGTAKGLIGLASEHRAFCEEDARLADGISNLASFALERKLQAEQRQVSNAALCRSEDRYRMIVDHLNDAFYIHDLQGNILDFNDNACDMLGYSRDELRGSNLAVIDTPENASLTPERMASLIRDGFLSFDGEHVRKDGTRVAINVSARLVSTEGKGLAQSFVRDITERLRLQEQLAQAQKMESIGRLAGGVAHDFNNLLAVILGYGEMMASSLPQDSPLRDHVSEILFAGERARDLTRQLLAFSRKQVLEMRTVELSSIVLGMKRMLQRLIGEDIDLQVIANPKQGFVRADTPQLEQVLMNLCVNARDAMPNGGRLVIETANVLLDEHYAGTHPGVTPGPYVVLSVSDTGQGMDEATRKRIFEPFFTTKEKGKGTGLGLSTVFGIIKQHGGEVWCYSEPGHGTTLKIYLPQAPPDLSPLGAREKEAPLLGNGETILVLEDEKDVRRLVCRMLANLHYVVLEAATVEECIELAKTNDKIDLLLTDVIMPNSDGRQVRNRVTEIQPGIRALYMSGYTENVIAHRGVLDKGIHFIPKPFTEAALSKKVREALSAPPEQP